MNTRLATWTLAALLLANLGCSGASQENNEENNSSSENNTAADNNTAANNQSANNTSSENNATTANNQTTPATGYDGLVINEVVASGTPDWVEFKNTSGAAIDLTGCTISDDLMDATKGVIPDGTMIPAGGYFVIDIADETVGFKIGGDEAFGIFAPDGAVIDSVDWDEGASPDGGAFARLPDGTGDFVTTNTPTREAANTITENNQTTENNTTTAGCGDGIKDGDDSCDGEDLGDATCEMLGFDGGELSCDASCELVTDACEMVPSATVVINEVTSSRDDQIELYNLGAVEVDLSGWIVADDKYPEDDTEIYTFATGSKIEPGAYLVLVKDTDHTFGVGGNDTVTLYNAGGDIVDQAAIDPDGAAETSFCRLPDATGDFQSCDVATFGASNE
jgi:hypothetical protein